MPIFLDFEASGLGPGSYPIEVAWGDTASGEVESHLIDPAPVPEWSEAIDPVALQMHGLTRDYLVQNGEHPDRVVGRMTEVLASHRVFCTSTEYDGMWAAKLFPEGECPFSLVDVGWLWNQLIESRPGIVVGGSGSLIRRAEASAGRRLQEEGWSFHRAEADVRYLMEMYRILMRP